MKLGYSAKIESCLDLDLQRTLFYSETSKKSIKYISC